MKNSRKKLISWIILYLFWCYSWRNLSNTEISIYLFLYQKVSYIFRSWLNKILWTCFKKMIKFAKESFLTYRETWHANFPLINDTSRKIIHIDMDAFLLLVEELATKLKGKPVIIGSDCVNGWTWWFRLVIMKPKVLEFIQLWVPLMVPAVGFCLGKLGKISNSWFRRFEIFKRYMDKIEPMSIDAGLFLDVTENKLGIKFSQNYKLIQHRMNVATTASVGVLYWSHKIASGYEKPHGSTIIFYPKRQRVFYVYGHC